MNKKICVDSFKSKELNVNNYGQNINKKLEWTKCKCQLRTIKQIDLFVHVLYFVHA